MSIVLRNPFNYEDLDLNALKNKVKTTKKCSGDKIEIDDTYIVCAGCYTIISIKDMLCVIENRDLELDKQGPGFQFLDWHGIFRCEEGHTDMIDWTFQCLIKEDLEAVHEDLSDLTFV